MAGATAARELGTRGKKCLVLEARNRTGGRTFTTEVFGERADVGGQWIHWLQPHVWAEMQRYGLQLLETPGANPAAYGVVVNGKLKPFDPAKAFELLNAGMQVFSKEVSDLFPRPFDPSFNPDYLKTDNISIAQRMKQITVSDETRAILESYFTTAVNGPIDQAGYLDQIHWYARAGNDMDRLLRACTQYKISTGTSSLIELLFRDSRAEVKLNTPVQRVEQSSRGVKVTAEDGKHYVAKSCIVALPMNCWNDIEWSPALLPGKVAASKERHVGSGFELKVKVKGNKGRLMDRLLVIQGLQVQHQRLGARAGHANHQGFTARMLGVGENVITVIGYSAANRGFASTANTGATGERYVDAMGFQRFENALIRAYLNIQATALQRYAEVLECLRICVTGRFGGREPLEVNTRRRSVCGGCLDGLHQGVGATAVDMFVVLQRTHERLDIQELAGALIVEVKMQAAAMIRLSTPQVSTWPQGVRQAFFGSKSALGRVSDARQLATA